MSELTDLSLFDLRQLLVEKKVSAYETMQAYLKRCDKLKDLNCYTSQDPEYHLNEARKSDERRAKGHSGPLEGLPIAVKDVFCTKGVRTTAASRILSPFIPPYESFVTQKLWQLGAILLGKTNMDEFSMGSSTTTSHYGPVVNPWRSALEPEKKRVAGGSSGGSAAAVAARLAPVALGGDTGGSIRQPASFCGVVGIKPSYGRCSRFGMIAFASSLDQAGVLAASAAEAGEILTAMSGHDPRDSTSLVSQPPQLPTNPPQDMKGVRVGLPEEYLSESLPAKTQEALKICCDHMTNLGARIHKISLPHTRYALPTYYIIAPAEASSNLARYDGVRYGWRAPLCEGDTLETMYKKTRSEGFGDEVKRRILIGTFVLSSGYYDAYYRKAQQVRQLVTNDFIQAFNEVDLLMTPTTPNSCFAHDGAPATPVEMYHNDIYTVPASLAGLPGISIPVALDRENLPIGIQLLGPPLGEAAILNGALALEQALGFTPWHKRKGGVV